MIASLLASLVCVQSPQFDPKEAELLFLSKSDILQSEPKSYALLMPELVSGALVFEFDWSPTGNCLLVQSGVMSPNPSVKIALWDRKTRKTKEIVSTTKGASWTWLGDGSGAYLTVGETSKGSQGEEIWGGKLLFVSSSGLVDPILPFSEAATSVEANPKDGRVLIYRSDLETSKTILLGKGKQLQEFRLDPPKEVRPYMVAWRDNKVIVHCQKQKGGFATYQLDMNNGSLSPYAWVPGPMPAENATALQVISGPSVAKDSEIKSFLLKKGESREQAIITADGMEAKLSPTETDVAYAHRGFLFVRKIRSLDPSELAAVEEKWERSELMSIGKQVGTAIHIFCADNDDMLPAAAGFYSKVEPYIKNSSMTNRFTYLLDGQKLSDIKDPASEIMGFVEGKHGRAVVYVDSHVRWESKRKP